jgi:signal transduction histidine kinase
MCHFYKNDEDLVGTLVPYFKAGLDRNERCLWITSGPVRVEDARSALRGVVPRVEKQMAAGQMEIYDFRDWYAKLGRFESTDVIARWIGFEEQALASGYAGLRLTGNTIWIADKETWDRFIQYEEALNHVFPSRSVLALCSYSTERCGCESVFDVVKNHQVAIVRRHGEWEVIESRALKLAKEELVRVNAELESRVSERTAELQGALRARDEFLSMASHELKTPLAALLLQLEGLGRPGRLEQAAVATTLERLGKALANGRRLAALVERMLDVSRLGEGLVPLSTQPVDLGALAREVLARLADQLQEAGCTATVHEGSAILGWWDRSRVDQVLTNLLVNAAKHARGAPVEVHVWAESGDAMLSVRDHGPGIPPADRERVFDRFVQLPGGHPDGFGLGLWLVRQIIVAHDGEVCAGEAEGGGARFVVRLPLNAPGGRGTGV